MLQNSVMTSSTTKTNTCLSFLCAFSLCCFYCCCAKDSITTGNRIDNGLEYLESAGKKFQMGFLQRQVTSAGRYVGVWYTRDPMTVVWVANRDNPVPDSTGFLTIAVDGEVKVQDKDQKIYFTTNKNQVASIGPTQRQASLKMLKLLDSGNVVLIDIASGITVWQSFLNPTDTFLPGMKMDSNLILTSWKSKNDPHVGNYSFQQDVEPNQYVIMNGLTSSYWKSGSGSIKSFQPHQLFIGVYNLLLNSSASKNNTPRDDYSDSRLLMNYTGHIQYFRWAEDEKQWVLFWEEPKDDCSIYQACGEFGLCQKSGPKCSCLPGFEPISASDYAAGCKRASEICGQSDQFMNVSMIDVENPSEPSFKSNNESDCQNSCLVKGNCQAYSYTPGDTSQLRSGRPEGVNSCWIWNSELNGLKTNGTHSIFIRVSGCSKVVLEIISGKRNMRSSQAQPTLSLLGYAWNLLKEDKPFELMDQTIVESSNSSEVLKCIIVGLLCVQEDPGDRPTMTNVLLMLGGDIASLPTPKQPVFVARKTMSSSSSSSYKPNQTQTNNALTISIQEGR